MAQSLGEEAAGVVCGLHRLRNQVDYELSLPWLDPRAEAATALAQAGALLSRCRRESSDGGEHTLIRQGETAMAFTAQDYGDLARLLVEHPEWRLELRRLLLSDELLALPETVRALAEAQRRTEERLEKLEATVENLGEQVGTLVEQVRALVEAQQRTTDTVGTLVEQVRALVEAQQRTTDTVGTLVEVQRRMTDTVGGLKGLVLELTYREKAGAYFGPLLRRLRVVEPHTLEDTLEASLTPGEFRDLLRLDFLLSGRPRQKPEVPEVWLAVEISSVVDQDDVDRAERRAGLLRKAGYRALPVAAGEHMTRGAEESARVQKVVLLQDGHILFWEEAMDVWAA